VKADLVTNALPNMGYEQDGKHHYKDDGSRLTRLKLGKSVELVGLRGIGGVGHVNFFWISKGYWKL
jgi:hypothetical protein